MKLSKRYLHGVLVESLRKVLNEHDNYYTKYSDIENELSNYDSEIFDDKVVMLCCDRPDVSKFWNYFVDNFYNLNLSMLISTYWEDKNLFNDVSPKMTIMTKNGIKDKKLRYNGDFLSDEIRDIMDYVDIVVTNPPFGNGVFSKFLQRLKSMGKKFIVIGPTKSAYDGKVFDMIKGGDVSIGYNKDMKFYDQLDNGKEKKVQSMWYTNFEKPNKGDFTGWFKSDFQRYDNIDAINIDSKNDIPKNYDGMMGIPPSVISDIDLNLYELVGSYTNLRINGKRIPKRIIIRRKGI